MKKVTLLLVLLVTALMGYAQEAIEVAPAQITEVEGFNPAAKRVYAELSCENQLFSTKVKVSIDFGQSTSWLSSMSESRLVDKDGKEPTGFFTRMWMTTARLPKALPPGTNSAATKCHRLKQESA